jgi:L-2-hydroxyglutarate oxidase LhgO
MPEKIDCAVIGAGVVGLAIARELALAGREVVLIEAEDAIGTHTSSRNSEVIHAGIFYVPGSLKARLCVEGKQLMYRYCAERGITHKRITKVIVATGEAQVAELGKYKRQAEANGVNDLQMLTREELRRIEPEVAAVAGFLSPSTGIVDSHALMLAYLGDAENRGASLVLSSPVQSGRVTGDGILLNVGGTQPMTVVCNTVVNTAGLYAQDVSRRVEGIPAATIPPTFYAIGHYYTLTGKSPFSRHVYPIARADWHGVHVTVDLGGRCKFGPDFEWIDRIDYRFDESREALFYETVRHYYPGLKDGALQPGYTGIRPKIGGPGKLVTDFLIQGERDHGVKGLIALYGIESPGLTSSLAIGAYVQQLLTQ